MRPANSSRRKIVVERHRALAADLQVLVEQEQTFVHRAQNVAGLFALPVRDGFVLAEVAREVEEDCAEQQHSGDNAEHLYRAQRAGAVAARNLDLRSEIDHHGAKLRVRGGGVLVEVLQRRLQTAAARAERNRRCFERQCLRGSGRLRRRVRRAGEAQHWIELRLVCVPEARPLGEVGLRFVVEQCFDHEHIAGAVSDHAAASEAAERVVVRLRGFAQRFERLVDLLTLVQTRGELDARGVDGAGLLALLGEKFDCRYVLGELASLAVVHRENDRDEHQEAGDREHDSLVSTEIQNSHERFPCAVQRAVWLATRADVAPAYNNGVI